MDTYIDFNPPSFQSAPGENFEAHTPLFEPLFPSSLSPVVLEGLGPSSTPIDGLSSQLGVDYEFDNPGIFDKLLAEHLPTFPNPAVPTVNDIPSTVNPQMTLGDGSGASGDNEDDAIVIDDADVRIINNDRIFQDNYVTTLFVPISRLFPHPQQRVVTDSHVEDLVRSYEKQGVLSSTHPMMGILEGVKDLELLKGVNILREGSAFIIDGQHRLKARKVHCVRQKIDPSTVYWKVHAYRPELSQHVKQIAAEQQRVNQTVVTLQSSLSDRFMHCMSVPVSAEKGTKAAIKPPFSVDEAGTKKLFAAFTTIWRAPELSAALKKLFDTFPFIGYMFILAHFEKIVNKKLYTFFSYLFREWCLFWRQVVLFENGVALTNENVYDKNNIKTSFKYPDEKLSSSLGIDSESFALHMADIDPSLSVESAECPTIVNTEFLLPDTLCVPAALNHKRSPMTLIHFSIGELIEAISESLSARKTIDSMNETGSSKYETGLSLSYPLSSTHEGLIRLCYCAEALNANEVDDLPDYFPCAEDLLKECRKSAIRDVVMRVSEPFMEKFYNYICENYKVLMLGFSEHFDKDAEVNICNSYRIPNLVLTQQVWYILFTLFNVAAGAQFITGSKFEFPEESPNERRERLQTEAEGVDEKRTETLDSLVAQHEIVNLQISQQSNAVKITKLTTSITDLEKENTAAEGKIDVLEKTIAYDLIADYVGSPSLINSQVDAEATAEAVRKAQKEAISLVKYNFDDQRPTIVPEISNEEAEQRFEKAIITHLNPMILEESVVDIEPCILSLCRNDLLADAFGDNLQHLLKIIRLVSARDIQDRLPALARSLQKQINSTEDFDEAVEVAIRSSSKRKTNFGSQSTTAARSPRKSPEKRRKLTRSNSEINSDSESAQDPDVDEDVHMSDVDSNADETESRETRPQIGRGGKGKGKSYGLGKGKSRYIMSHVEVP